MLHRPRRLRTSKSIRSLVSETNLNINDLIYPLFMVTGENVKEEIASLPGCYHYSVDRVGEELAELVELGIKAVLIFGIPESRDQIGSRAWAEDGIVQKAVREIKSSHPEIIIITDICLCAYTDHGHCGLIKEGRVDNDSTLELLTRIAISHARAGADILAPSDMMDGRIRAIRNGLEKEGFTEKAIMSYSAKYASGFYGPFRDAAHSAPGFGDRSGYQMDFANSREALKEVKLDIEEGADMVMVKPALSYLDIIRQVKDNTNVPVTAYSVSGEYSMIKNAARAGLCDEERIMIEVITSIKRAGADLIITYFAKDIARLILNGVL